MDRVFQHRAVGIQVEYLKVVEIHRHDLPTSGKKHGLAEVLEMKLDAAYGPVLERFPVGGEVAILEIQQGQSLGFAREILVPGG